ncbi:TonB-dependent receptor [Pseudoduganella aquatica]|uniref:TonB-dependent receptor n=1 Tax=Pseudoduganella aquatica TaxID=2660641 RepID=A0A7X4H8Q2_9BURK|nr:TonB-dependent receptor [Pseudoduganella aquatica]MYN06734.1 TonB-dependent receptor [Pseudoduganella aquatica]
MKIPGTHKASAFRRSRCTHAVLLALGSMGLSVYAQTMPRVEITGSSIKRIEGEAALPVEIIKREDIDKSGVTTAAELLQKISSNVGGLTDGASVSDVMGGQRGFNGANLRGLGVSSTLVLLNGRRMANFASPGDNSGVDLNNIPAGAIQRVEVLKDGASAIYGTDAMGGVINFITRKDYQGGDASLYALGTDEGGGGKKSASLSGGFGALSTDRFNVFGALDLQRTDRLASSQREFMQEYSLPDRLSPQLSSYSFPANVDLTAAQLATLNKSGYLKGAGPGGTYVPSQGRRVNFGRSSCVNGSPNVVRPLGPGGSEGCSFNYMGDSEVYPESKKQSFVGRATALVGDNHQVFAEVLLSKAETSYAASPATSSSISASNGILLPADLQAKTGITTPVTFRFRLSDAGRRTSEVTSKASRFVVGAAGKAGDWEYDAAYNHSVNKATDLDIDGWVSRTKMLAGIASGKYNPFVPATDDSGRKFMDSIKINGAARISKGTSDSVDGKLTRSLMALPGGDVMLAVGAELRREKTAFTSTEALRTNDVQGDRASSDELLADSSNSRDIAGIYTEINAPFSKEWEGQFAIRHDRYKAVHDPLTKLSAPQLSTTNPKIAVSYRPNKEVLGRASYGTGFRAPSIAELFLPVRSGTTASFVKDPVSGEVAQFDLDRYGNPKLKPEKSKQFSAGLVVEPNQNWNASLDYWIIRKTDIISEIGEQTVFDNPVYYNDPKIVVRDEDGLVSYLQFKKENRGKLNTSGLDIAVNWRGDATSMGRFSASLNGTLVTQYKFQSDPNSPMADGLGVFRDDKAVQRWRHKVNLDWTQGPVNLSLGNTFFSSYTDQNVPGLADPGWNDRKVKAYSLWDLTGSYAFTKQLKLRAGVINLADTPPPFTNQSRYFEVTWDPTYGDPRGRSMFANLQYKF